MKAGTGYTYDANCNTASKIDSTGRVADTII